MARNHDELHSEVSARVFLIANNFAGIICALAIAEVWGRWHAVGAMVATWLVMGGFNAWVSKSLLKRRGVIFGESVRCCGNLIAIVFLGVAGDFPFALWMWIPFAPLVYDQVDSRVSTAMTIASALIVNTMAIRAGYTWHHAITLDGIAIMALLIGRTRLSAIRQMLLQSDEQRQQLAVAHRRLVDEVRVREQIEIELRQAQKLEAIGRLASGIAHEINTPVQFVSDSVHFVDDATRDLLELATRSRVTLQALVEGTPIPEVMAALARAEEAADLPYVAEQLPMAIGRVVDGLERITTIVRSMKEFAHPDQRERIASDLNRALLATITVAAHEYKLVADVDFDPGDLPGVVCRPGELNQVFLNLIVNAAHAIGDVVQDSGRRGRITIATRVDGTDAVITIGDTGIGIPAEIRDRIFDPFFTTKEVGRGTGQGLAIARNVIRHHGGSLTFESEVGHGTTFTIRLPLAPTEPEALVLQRPSAEMPAAMVH